MTSDPDRIDPQGPRPMRAADEVAPSDFWDVRYAERETPWDLGAASPPLVTALDALDAGDAPIDRSVLAPGARVAVLGCGRGHDAVAIAARGYDVVGYDYSPSAVALATEGAAASGSTARFEERDLFGLGGEEAGRFDLVVEHTCFCAIHPSRRDDYVAVAHTILRPGGVFLGLMFPFDPNWRGGPPYEVSEDDIAGHFGSHFDVLDLSEPTNSVPSRHGLERLAWLRALALENGDRAP